MKKFTLVLAAVMASLTASATYTLNNPVGADGRYIVKYDCATGQFATANDMEVDETFTFAVDITGTWLEEFVKKTPKVDGATRGIAINKWTSKGDVDGETNRLKQITGNIYGMTVNYAQIFGNDSVLNAEVLKKDSILYIYAKVFGFEFTADNKGAGWWMWEDNSVDNTQADGSDCLFAFPAYTGTKTSPEFYTDDFEEPMFGYETEGARKGYAAPCVTATSVEDVKSVANKGGKFVENGQLYILSNGVKYNVLGVEVK